MRSKRMGIHNYHVFIQHTSQIDYFTADPKSLLHMKDKKTFTHAYFDDRKNIFYWMTANNIDDFESGYSTTPFGIDSTDIEVNLINNTYSPFIFLNAMTIRKLDIVRNTRFVQYELYNQQYRVTYRGIIDIELNLIIFNTDVETTRFQPYGNYTILIITEKDAYKTCLIKYNNECVDRCPENTKLVIDNINGNRCDSKCNKYTLKPSDVCIDYCNITL